MELEIVKTIAGHHGYTLFTENDDAVVFKNNQHRAIHATHTNSVYECGVCVDIGKEANNGLSNTFYFMKIGHDNLHPYRDLNWVLAQERWDWRGGTAVSALDAIKKRWARKGVTFHGNNVLADNWTRDGELVFDCLHDFVEAGSDYLLLPFEDPAHSESAPDWWAITIEREGGNPMIGMIGIDEDSGKPDLKSYAGFTAMVNDSKSYAPFSRLKELYKNSRFWHHRDISVSMTFESSNVTVETAVFE